MRGRTSVSPAGFARLAGHGLRVIAGAGGTASAAAELTAGGELGVPELVAEAALLQVRLDWFQSQLARLGERGPGGAGQG